MTTNTIPELLAVPPEEHDLPWLQTSLQAAVDLELSTIPPYLCGMWSIKRASEPAYALIKSVVLEEMLHMGLVCNMLTAIGGTPKVNAPVYPGPLPGGVHPGLTVSLAGLTKSIVENVYMQIEMPEHPVALGAEEYPTIGAFYDAIAAAFQAQGQQTFPTEAQLSVSVLNLTQLATLADVLKAIETIKEQGEGTSTSPDAPISGDELAHYYRFGEILNGKRLVKVSTNPDKWAYTGDPVAFPDVFPMAPVPAGGYPQLPGQADFDSAYANMLTLLQQAWNAGPQGQQTLNDAVGVMRALKSKALPLMKTPLPSGTGNYGPDFVVPPKGE